MALKLVAAFAISAAVTSVAGILLIPALKKIKAGQTIRSDGPVWHGSKQGTPIMGGLMFMAGTTLAFLSVGFSELRENALKYVFVLIFALVYAFIGFLDDRQKLLKKRNLGLTAKQKLILQVVFAAGFVVLMRINGITTTDLYIPFVNTTIHIPDAIYYIFAAFVIVGTVNAVNITDGVDGLATGVAIPAAVCYTVIAAVWGYVALGIFSAAFAGGLAAFLVVNFHPAKIFMGDTGAFFIGGAICALAFALDVPLILVPIAIVFLIETLSDIIQVTYFKLTHGKRVFKMAPLHHHYEMIGWGENKIFWVYSAVSAIFAVVAYFGVYMKQ